MYQGGTTRTGCPLFLPMPNRRQAVIGPDQLKRTIFRILVFNDFAISSEVPMGYQEPVIACYGLLRPAIRHNIPDRAITSSEQRLPAGRKRGMPRNIGQRGTFQQIRPERRASGDLSGTRTSRESRPARSLGNHLGTDRRLADSHGHGRRSGCGLLRDVGRRLPMVAAKEGPVPAGTLSRETPAPDGDTKARTCFREIFSPENRAAR